MFVAHIGPNFLDHLTDPKLTVLCCTNKACCSFRPCLTSSSAHRCAQVPGQQLVSAKAWHPNTMELVGWLVGSWRPSFAPTGSQAPKSHEDRNLDAFVDAIELCQGIEKRPAMQITSVCTQSAKQKDPQISAVNQYSQRLGPSCMSSMLPPAAALFCTQAPRAYPASCWLQLSQQQQQQQQQQQHQHLINLNWQKGNLLAFTKRCPSKVDVSNIIYSERERKTYLVPSGMHIDIFHGTHIIGRISSRHGI